MKTRLLLLSLLVLAPASGASGCATGASGSFEYDAGLGPDASPATGPPVVFPPDDPSSQADDGGTPDDAPLFIPLPSDDASEDAAPSGPTFDAGPGGECSGALSPGDLAIDELLVESLSGTGDHGEWLEVQSTRDCALDLVGLHAEAPVGAKLITMDVTADVWLPARGAFVIADSLDPGVNHALPGLVLGWAGSPGDVLRNEGSTVSLLAGDALIDAVTYPDIKKYPVGTSMAYPSDCPLGARATWALWQPSQASWFPGFYGTPNAPNDDVHCADD